MNNEKKTTEKSNRKRKVSEVNVENNDGSVDGDGGVGGGTLPILLPTDPIVPAVHASKISNTDQDAAEDTQNHNEAMLMAHEIPAVMNIHQNRHVPDDPVGLDGIGMNIHHSMSGPISTIMNSCMASYAAAAMAAASQQIWQINRMGLPTTAGTTASGATVGATAVGGAAAGAGASSTSLFVPYGPPWPKKADKYMPHPSQASSDKTLQAKIMQLSSGGRDKLSRVPPGSSVNGETTTVSVSSSSGAAAAASSSSNGAASSSSHEASSSSSSSSSSSKKTSKQKASGSSSSTKDTPGTTNNDTGHEFHHPHASLATSLFQKNLHSLLTYPTNPPSQPNLPISFPNMGIKQSINVNISDHPPSGDGVSIKGPGRPKKQKGEKTAAMIAQDKANNATRMRVFRASKGRCHTTSFLRSMLL